MRAYAEKMKRYKLNRRRYAELRDYCRQGASPEIRQALEKTGGGLSLWIERHVCSDDWKWARLQAAGIPCNGDTFRVYRARFYWHLDAILRVNGANHDDRG